MKEYLKCFFSWMVYSVIVFGIGLSPLIIGAIFMLPPIIALLLIISLPIAFLLTIFLFDKFDLHFFPD